MSIIDTNNLLLELVNIDETMKLKIVIIGVMFVLTNLSYNMIPSFVIKAMNELTFGNSDFSVANQVFSQIGLPPIPSTQLIITFIQYLYAGLIVAGFGLIVFGVMSKKVSKLDKLNVHLESIKKSPEEKDADVKTLFLLQERLAKGEITSSQYYNLKKLLEEKRHTNE